MAKNPSKTKSGKKKTDFELFLESTQSEEGELNFQQLIGLTRTVESIIRGLGNFPRDAEDYTMNPLKETITHVEQLKNPDSNPYHIGSVSIAAPNLQTTSELDKAVRSWDRILGAKHDLRIKFEALDSIMNPTEDSKPYLVDEGEFRFIMGHFGIEIPNYEFLQIEEFPVQLNVLIQLVPRLLSTIGLPEIPVGLMHKLFYFLTHEPDVEGTGLPTISSMKWFKYYYKNDLHKFLNAANSHSIKLPSLSFLEHKGPKTIEEISVASAESFCKQFDTIALSVIKPDFLENYAFTDFDFEKIITPYFEKIIPPDFESTPVVWKHKLFVEDVAYGLQNISEKYYGTMEYVDNTRSAANANQSQQESREDILAMNTVRLREEMRQKKRMRLIFLELSHNFLTSSGRDGVSLLCDMVGSNIETVPESTLEHFIDYCLMFEPRSILENCKESGNNDYDKFMLLVGQAPYARSATMEKLNERQIYVDCSRLPSNYPTISQDTFDGENACLVNVNVKSIDDSFLLFHIKCVLNKWIQDTENVINSRRAPKYSFSDYANAGAQKMLGFGGSALEGVKTGVAGVAGSANNYFQAGVAGATEFGGSAFAGVKNGLRDIFPIHYPDGHGTMGPFVSRRHQNMSAAGGGGGPPAIVYANPFPNPFSNQPVSEKTGGGAPTSTIVNSSGATLPIPFVSNSGQSRRGLRFVTEKKKKTEPKVHVINLNPSPLPPPPPAPFFNTSKVAYDEMKRKYGVNVPHIHVSPGVQPNNTSIYNSPYIQQPIAAGGSMASTNLNVFGQQPIAAGGSSTFPSNMGGFPSNMGGQSSAISSIMSGNFEQNTQPDNRIDLGKRTFEQAIPPIDPYYGKEPLDETPRSSPKTSPNRKKTRKEGGKPKRNKKTLRRNPRKLMSRRQKYSRRK